MQCTIEDSMIHIDDFDDVLELTGKEIIDMFGGYTKPIILSPSEKIELEYGYLQCLLQLKKH